MAKTASTTTVSSMRRDDSSNYTPTHGNLMSGKGITRSCGKCNRHKPIQSKGKKHRVYGWVCLECSTPKEKPNV